MNFFNNCYHFIKMKIAEYNIDAMKSFLCINTLKLDKLDRFKYPLKNLLKEKLALEDYWVACELMDELCDMAQINGLKTNIEIFEEISK